MNRRSTIKHQTRHGTSPSNRRTSNSPQDESVRLADIKLCCHGFTLIELLVVMGIIALLMALVAPAVTSLSKSNGRIAAVSALLGAIEQARAEAIKSGQATYFVFPIFTSGTQSTLDRYNCKSYAIFEDDPAYPGGAKQLTSWNPLPTGVALRSRGTASLSNLANPNSLSPVPTFTFAPDASAAPTYKCLKFNSNGEIEAPVADVLLGVFEGFVNGTNEVITGATDGGNPPNPLAVGYIAVSRWTGRAEPTATP